MKHDIFISYSNDDKDKVDLIVAELKDHTKFNPVVIADNREALKPLAEKVANGIRGSIAVIPILTEKSYQTQWINQEIGFATALSYIKIYPIVEKELTSKLKGFIHKQIDLPYNFVSSDNEKQGNFINCFRLLLADLEKEFATLNITEKRIEKSIYERTLEKADEYNAKSEFEKKKQVFFNSSDGLAAAQNEISSMFQHVRNEVNKLQDKNFRFSPEENFPCLIIKSEGFSFSIDWSCPYNNSLKDSTLYVQYWEGHISKQHVIHLKQPKELEIFKYDFDQSKDGSFCWTNQLNKRDQYTSQQITEDCLSWIIQKIIEKRNNVKIFLL